MKIINMMSTADKVKGQGVGSAYLEQVALVKDGLKNDFEIKINSKENSDIVHYHTIDIKHFFHSSLSKNRINVGYVHFLPETIDGSLKLPIVIKPIFYKYIIAFYKKMDYLVTVNPFFIGRLEALGIKKSKILYIPNYVAKEKFYPLAKLEINELKNKYNINNEKFVVLGVGQIQTRKGVLDFIELANKNKDILFVWAGGFSFGKITDGYSELKKIVDNPPKNVRFLGILDRDDMNGIYNISDLLFMPSYNELFPMAILETMNVEKPMLLRDIDIYKDILKNYYLKGKNNIEFDKIIKRLSNDKEYYLEGARLSKKGGEFYSKEFVLKQWSKFYNDIYEERFD